MTRHSIFRSLLLVPTAAVALSLAACGGGSDDRPTTGEISKSLQGGDAADLIGAGSAISSDLADCMAKALHDSDVSDKTLRALVDGNKDYKPADSERDNLTDVTKEMSKCATSATK